MSPATPPPRNAVTSLSFTLFRLKTASVPTSVKLYQAVPLHEDLQNELASATVKEDPLWTGNNHIVLHLCTFFQVSQGAVPALSKLKDGQTPLYDTTSNCWQPTYLPYILRFSADLDSQSALGREQHGHSDIASMSVSQSIALSKNQRRRLTITRTVDGPNSNSVIETKQITYLLKPGSEEGKVAAWLNHINTALCSIAPPPSSQPQMRSRTKTLADT
ncbi:hypothetical protein JVT61DRAFT_13623 [Boletus reticuloceps]|uniref:Uncharacterized protein n=1 Tax=Boletus reticuloceps TaxID=495285 RepID=A0A8I3A3N2_9AGAM|nr:hypothetical protein JVT61DRAFT_13623 [Boletus reticuloceps]